MKKDKTYIPCDYLMWVGSIHYPSVDDYIAEAKERGVCKRMGKLPRELVPGKSRIFLAHDDGIAGEGFIFGYFIPNAIEYLAHSDSRIPTDIYDRVEFVSLKSVDKEPERLCGFRHEGMYLVDREKYEGGEFVIFDRPRKLEMFTDHTAHFRGLLIMENGEAIIQAQTSQAKKLFRIPPSRKAISSRQTDPWTEGEDLAIVETLGSVDIKAPAAQKLAYRFGKTRAQVLYRFYLLTAEKE